MHCRIYQIKGEQIPSDGRWRIVNEEQQAVQSGFRDEERMVTEGQK